MHLVVSKTPAENHRLTATAANAMIGRALPKGTLKIAVTQSQRETIESHNNRRVDITRERYNQPPTAHTGEIVDFHEVSGTLFAELSIR